MDQEEIFVAVAIAIVTPLGNYPQMKLSRQMKQY